jgi:hypothetical protein
MHKMMKWRKLSAALLIFAAIVTWDPGSAISQAVQLVVVDVAAVAKGYRASKLLHASVRNDKNEKIGSIDDIIIGHDRLLFAVLEVGGFLGMGAHLVAVPYQSLVLEEDGGKIVLPGASKDELKKLPEFGYRD